MKVVVKQSFYDLACTCDRVPGDVFEADAERVAQINQAGFGILVEAAEQDEKPSKSRKGKAAQE